MRETKTCNQNSESYENLIFGGAAYLIRYRNVLAKISLRAWGLKSENHKDSLNSIDLILEVLQYSCTYVGNAFIIYMKSAFRHHSMKLGKSNIMKHIITTLK